MSQHKTTDSSQNAHTDQKADAALLKSVVETVVDGIITIDESGIIITANPAITKIFGYKPDEIVGKNVKLLMPEPYHGEHDQYLTNYRDTGHRKIIGIGREVSGLRKDGTVFPMELAVGETTTAKGRIFTGIIRDISERKKAEEDLRRERALLSAVVETAVDGIITIDQAGKIRTVNPATATIFGYSPEELIGQNVRILMPSPYHENHDQYLSNYLGTGKPKIIGIGREVEGIRKNGQIFPLDLAVSKTETEDGLVFTGIIRDITDQKLAAEALKNANIELELKVQQRTAELALTNKELLEAKDTAETANLYKSTFLSRMSHELRTPMNAILGFGQLLEMSNLDEEAKDSLAHILKAGHHLLSLINDVLEISRVEIGELSISHEPVEIGELLGECHSLMRTIASERKVTIDIRTDPSLYVWADRQKLRQVALNIISNAIKYNRIGGKVVIDSRVNSEGKIEIDFSDTGFGISPKNMSKLFTPFERFDVGGIEGTGLGLALSRSLTEAMGGTLTANSVEGEGSCFTITLENAEQKYVKTKEDLPKINADFLHKIERATILVIEDNLTNVALLERVFSSRPRIELIVAMQGGLGIELAQKHKPDIILLDLHLPDINGDRVMSALKADPQIASIPIIMMSADAFASRSKAMLDAGAFRYITKPFDLHDLVTAIDDALQLIKGNQ